MKKWFLGLQGLVVICMTVLIALGHNSAITATLLGVAGSLFGVNAWALLRDKPTAPGTIDKSGTIEP